MQFKSYLKQQGFDSNLLINFTGNHYNVLFANGGRVFQLNEHIINFLQKLWGTPNRLVLNDAENDLNMAGCKALGLLIDKYIHHWASMATIRIKYPHFGYTQVLQSFAHLRPE